MTQDKDTLIEPNFSQPKKTVNESKDNVAQEGNYNSVIDKKLDDKVGDNHSQINVEIKQGLPQNISPSSNSQKLSLGLLAGGIVFLIAIVGTIGYLGFHLLLDIPNKIDQKKLVSSTNVDNDNFNDLNLLLEKLETQYQQGDYQNCYKLGIESPHQDNFVIQEWIGKCGLIIAKIKADLNSFSGAIAIAKTIPNNVSNYSEIQDNINIWSNNILDYATSVYRQGKLEEAIKITQIVSENSNLKVKIPELISQWQQEEIKHKTLIDNAQNLLNRGQWYAAKQEVAKIPPDFIFWRQKAQPILERANQKINAIATERRRRREQQRRRIPKKPPRVQQLQQQRPKVPPKTTTPLPSLRERLKNTPLLDDKTLRERLGRKSNR